MQCKTMIRCFITILVGVIIPLASNTTVVAANIPVIIDGQVEGRTFEGLGALSAGASSRLLIEYPEPQRSQILDLLFKPGYGASFHHLKVEIGGNVNSTDGTEPSYAHTREEFENPKPEYFERGYEWWLMKEARKRNPAIYLDILQWGASDWIGDKDYPDVGDPHQLTWEKRIVRNRNKFYTQDNADYIAGFINAAKTYHGVDINYCGIWNEMPYDTAWIKRLRQTLDAKGLKQVQIVAADTTHEEWRLVWNIANDMLKDKTLMDAVSVVGGHYPGPLPYTAKTYQSTVEAQQTGKPIWSSEDGPWRGDWQGARELAKLFNRNYIVGKMTKTVIWSLITSYYENLPVPNSGPMKANQPWSGHFEIQPAIWAIAHTTQFTKPGWHYLDGACTTIEGGSIVTLRSPDKKDITIIIETADANSEQILSIKASEGFLSNTLHVWRSTELSQFDKIGDLKSKDGYFSISLLPKAIYTLTTTTGQQKGLPDSPQAKDFPLPYKDDFESYKPGKTPRYFSDQGGVFETANRSDANGVALEQVICQRGIDWNAHPTPEPYSMIGSTKWRNYKVSCEVYIKNQGYAAIFGRIISSPQSSDPPSGYWIKVDVNGAWQLKAGTDVLAFGHIPFDPNKWHSIELKFCEHTIFAVIDGNPVCTFQDSRFRTGMAGLGTGWNKAYFDNFSIKRIETLPAFKNLAEGKEASASSVWSGDYTAAKAMDGDFLTRWNAADETKGEQWLEVDLGEVVKFNKIGFTQFENRIESYKVQYWDGVVWSDAFIGNAKAGTGNYQEASFMPVKADKVRLLITRTNGRSPSIYELEIYNASAEAP